jgi:alkylation response protein AidB-like acyl-CoA dehydrogenase
VDFAYHYTPGQEDFRREIALWLDANLLNVSEDAVGDSAGDTREHGRKHVPDRQRSRDELRRRLGARGWLAPLDSSELGGGGLNPDENVVLLEELNKRGMLLFLEDATLALRTALLSWGSPAQRDRLVRPLAAGRVVMWRQRSVGRRPLDPDAVGVTAVPDADGYILNGKADFSGSGPSPSWLWTLALVESDGPDQPAAASFLVPPTLDGIEITTPRTMADDLGADDSGGSVVFNRVWVPRSDMLGDDGGVVMQSTVPRATGADLPTTVETETDALLDYARSTESNGVPLSAEPVRQQLLVEAYIASRVMRLLRMRAGWLGESRQGEGHEDAEAALWEERASQRLSKVVQQVVGVYAQLDESDPRAAASGRFERLQRGELAARAAGVGGGSTEELIATALGLIAAQDPAGERSAEGEQGPA